MKKLEDIEKLRGLACILVFIQHIVLICPFTFLAQALPQWLWVGSGGVHVFFAISGFVVTLSLMDKLATVSGDTFIDRLKNARTTLKSFYSKRFFRIMPVMMFVWVILGIFLLCTEGNFKWLNGFFRVPIEVLCGMYQYSVEAYIGYEKVHAAGAGPFWTLAVESQFYLLWPVVLLMCKNNNSRAILSLLTGLFFLFVVMPISISTFGYKYYAIYNNISGLFLGSFFGLVFDPNKDYNLKNKYVVSLVMLIGFIVVWTFRNLLPDDNFVMHVVVGITSVFMVVVAAFANGAFRIPFITSFLEFLGRRSYSFYAIQLTLANIVMWYVNSIYFPIQNSTPFLQFLVYVCVLFLSTEVVYNYIERPSRKIGMR